jgi:hypothetical protein
MVRALDVLERAMSYLELGVEGGRRDAERARRLGLVAGELLQGLADRGASIDSSVRPASGRPSRVGAAGLAGEQDEVARPEQRRPRPPTALG